MTTAEQPTPTADLVAALGDLHEPPKAGKVNAGQRRYDYLTLPDLMAAIRPVFAAHRLAVSQTVEYADGAVTVRTTILHTSGHQWDAPPLTVRAAADPQSIGSTTTYLRRYALAAMTGLAGDVDDDGQQHRPPADTPAQRRRAADPPRATPEQLHDLGQLLAELEAARALDADPDMRRLLVAQLAGLDQPTSATDLTPEQAAAAIAALQAELRAAQ